jgi:hypothetical protein
VAATEIQSLHRGPFAYDRSAPLSAHYAPHFESPVGAAQRYSNSRHPSRPELTRSWSEKNGSEGFYGKDFMSKQTGDRGLQGSSNRPEIDAGRPSTSLAHFPQHGQQGMQSTLPGIGQNAPKPPQSQTGIQLPPLPHAASVTSGSFPPPRAVGLPSILNPSTESEQPRGLRRKADQLDSPPSSIASLPPLITSVQPGGIGNRSDTPSNPYGSVSQATQNRPIITPRSPGLQRPATYQSFHPPTGTISALKSPFPTSPRTRSHTIETGAQNFPTPPAVSRPSYEYAAHQQHDYANASRRASLGGSRLHRAPSSSASPSTTYSSFSHVGGYDDRQRPVGIPISSSSGQNVYQMMTLETTSGTVQLPVDVQAASKVADEKRKRNAGASARFRQRRKEKERESSTTISKLEQRLKAAADDADFYKRERDYMAGILLQVPGGDRHFPRPQSPQHRRSSTITSAMSTSGSAGYMSGSEQFSQRSPEQDRNVRRRTSVSSLPPPPPPVQMSGPPQSTPGFAGPQYMRTPGQYHPSTTLPSPLGGRGATHLPPPSQLSQHPGSSTMQAPPQTGPWNPYAARHPQPPRTQS